MKMTTEEAFIKILQMHGLEHAFGIIGSAMMPVSDLFPKAGIKFWDCANETNAGMMADGFSRATGTMSITIGQNGPGVTGFITAIKTAYWNHTPLLMVTPQAANKTIGLGGFQEVDQMAMFEEMVCYQEEVRESSRIPEVLNRVILNGAGVVIGNAIAESIALAERLDAPVCCGYQHNDAFPGNHRLSVGPLGYNGSKAAMELINKADVVLALGTRLNPFSTLPSYGIDYWPKNASIIQVDINADRIGLTKKVSVGICGDAKQVAHQLLEQLSPSAGNAGRDERTAAIYQTRSAWFQQLSSMDHEDDDLGTEWNEDAHNREPNRMSPRQAWRQYRRRFRRKRSSRLI